MIVGEGKSSSKAGRGSSQGRFCLVKADERPSTPLLAVVLEREAEQRWKEKEREKQKQMERARREAISMGGVASSSGGRDERFASAVSSASSGTGSGKGFFVGSFASSSGSSGSGSASGFGGSGSMFARRSRRESLGVGGEMRVGAGIGIGAGIGVGAGMGSGLAAGLAGISSMASAAMGFKKKGSGEGKSSGGGGGGDPSSTDSVASAEPSLATLSELGPGASSGGGFSLGLSDGLSDAGSSDGEFMSELLDGNRSGVNEDDLSAGDDGDEDWRVEDGGDGRDGEDIGKDKEREAERQVLSDGDGPLSDGGGGGGGGYASDGVATPGRRASIRRNQKHKRRRARDDDGETRPRGKHRSLGSSGGMITSLAPPKLSPPALSRRAVTTEASDIKVSVLRQRTSREMPSKSQADAALVARQAGGRRINRRSAKVSACAQPGCCCCARFHFIQSDR